MIEKGQSLFEVVIALAISAIVIIALVSVVSSSIQNANFSRDKTLASNYVQETIEWLRSQRDNDITTFETNTQIPNWCFQTLSWNPAQIGFCSDDNQIANTRFFRDVIFTRSTVACKTIDCTIVEVEVDVHWFDSQGSHEVKGFTNFSDWRER